MPRAKPQARPSGMSDARSYLDKASRPEPTWLRRGAAPLGD